MPSMNAEAQLLLPVMGHLALILFLFVMVSYKRWQATQANFSIDKLASNGSEPEPSRRWAKNLDNQFQIPMLFYPLIALLIATQFITMTMIMLAWVFLFGRIVHTVVQTSSDNVILRGRVFLINFLALAFMWLIFFANRFELI